METTVERERSREDTQIRGCAEALIAAHGETSVSEVAARWMQVANPPATFPRYRVASVLWRLAARGVFTAHPVPDVPDVRFRRAS